MRYTTAEYKNYPTSLKRINVQTLLPLDSSFPHSHLPFQGPWLLHHICCRQVSAGEPIPRPDRRKSQTARIYLRRKTSTTIIQIINIFKEGLVQ